MYNIEINKAIRLKESQKDSNKILFITPKHRYVQQKNMQFKKAKSTLMHFKFKTNCKNQI